MKRLIAIISSAFVLATTPVFAGKPVPADRPLWGIAYYHSWMTDDNIAAIVTLDSPNFRYGTMDTIEISRELAPDNWLRKFLQPVLSTIQIAGNVTRRDDPNGIIYEFDPYIILRWQHFPWDKYLVNSFAFGDGLSYTTAIPLREAQDTDTGTPKRLLNFLMLEATFALPSHPEWQLFTRVHHRCGAWGLFGAGNLSSNAIGVGFRYLF